MKEVSKSLSIAPENVLFSRRNLCRDAARKNKEQIMNTVIQQQRILFDNKKTPCKDRLEPLTTTNSKTGQKKKLYTPLEQGSNQQAHHTYSSLTNLPYNMKIWWEENLANCH